MLLYRSAPPATVSVHDEKVIGSFNTENNELALFDKNISVEKFAHWHVHNKFEVVIRPNRAAMLQGAEPVTTANKLQDGWVACSERMPGEVLAALQNVARLRRNLNDFCGDKSLIAKCLSEAEGALLNAVNRHSTMLAEPLNEAKNV